MLHSGTHDLHSRLSAFVDDGAFHREPVVVVPANGGGALREATVDGRGSSRTQFEVVSVDSDRGHPRAAGALRAYRELLDDRLGDGARCVRLIIEPLIGDSVEEQLDWARCEAVINRAFATTAATILCVYDERALPPSAFRDSLVEQIACTHPRLLTANGPQDSDSYLDPAQIFGDLASPHLPLEDSEPVLDLPIDRSMGIPRQAVGQAVASAQLPAERVRDLVVAFNEVATNAVVHGRGAARVRVWTKRDLVVCTVSDEGTSFRDRLAGYVPLATAHISDRGMGLWLSRQLCDEVDIVPSAEGLDVRLLVRS